MKRFIDIVGSSIGILLFFPILLLIAIMVLYKHGSPIIFSQVRPGLNKKLFKMIKFRTMTSQCDDNGNLLPDDMRLTNFGKFLRSTSLDELPELINVLKGDMSLVGPRPLLVDYLPLYSERQSRRHEVRPGITGWAQINGRNALSWEEKFELDVWYVENRTLWLDIKILLLTVWKVISKDGISADGEATMPAFQGTKKSEQNTDVKSH